MSRTTFIWHCIHKYFPTCVLVFGFILQLRNVLSKLCFIACISKWFCVVIKTRCKLSFACMINIVLKFLSVETLGSYTMYSLKQYPSRGQQSLLLQLQLCFLLESAESIFVVLLNNTGHVFHAAVTQFLDVLIKYFIQFVVFWRVLFD